MGRIALSDGYSLIPEGSHIFKIVGASYKEQFGKLEIKMKTAKGQTHIERFTLIKKDGTSNEGALKAFSFFARTALNDYSAQDIDPNELIGCYIECDVEHDEQPSSKNPGKTVKFTRLTDKRPADGFGEGEIESAPKQKTEVKAGNIDLDALLG